MEQSINKIKTALIIGAGPAGLTAAFEFLKRTDVQPVVLEKSQYMGGISRTTNYKGNRIDIGGHRFFSKSDRVMSWWLNIMPLQASSKDSGNEITYQNSTRPIDIPSKGPDPDKDDKIMLLRKRKSRLYFSRKFFDYPISLSVDTIKKLGIPRTIKMGISYIKSVIFPIKPEKNLEQFFTNRFGRELYLTFFKSYTEKVWGVSCQDISAEWGAQRVKGLSIITAILHALKKMLNFKTSIEQKNTETSLIEQFLYPKYGPGQMWEEVADQIRKMGGEIHTEFEAVRLFANGQHITAVEVRNTTTGQQKIIEADYFFSTMPVKELVRAINIEVPSHIKEISEGLVYRDFITVGLLVDNLKIKDKAQLPGKLLDNWIYIHDPTVKLGRLQIFNNWSPYMVSDGSKHWLGLEYFCNETDELWQKSDDEMKQLAISELESIGLIEKKAVCDATVIHVPKAYPGYFGTYDSFDQLKQYLDQFDNLYLIGRNGMHKYNNQDHSMLTAMTAVDNIIAGVNSKDNIWSVNTESEYHEEKNVPQSTSSATSYSNVQTLMSPAPQTEEKQVPNNVDFVPTATPTELSLPG